MLTLPPQIMPVLQHFTPVFSERIWDWVQILVLGAILAPRQRTVTAALRILGLSGERQFQNYHRVLNRARWSGLRASRILLGLLVAAFVPPGAPVLLAADDSLERRRGACIAAKGHFRDPVRSSASIAVSSEGLRWVSMLLLVRLPWSSRVWALPFLTLLAPHAKTNAALGVRHKTVIDWIGQMILLVRRWLPRRRLVLITDGGLIAVKLGLRCAQQGIVFVSRLHLNVRLFDPPAPQPAGKGGKPPRLGPRQPSLQARLDDPATVWTRQRVRWYGGKPREVEFTTGTALWQTPSQSEPLPIRWVLLRDPRGTFQSAALCCTDVSVDPEQLIAWYVLRWNVEVTFQESRTHLGVETQRQWNALSIARTTPALLALFSLVVLLAHQLLAGDVLPTRQAAWYRKREATFVDVLAFVRGYLWREVQFANSRHDTRFVPLPVSALHTLLDTVCYVT